MSPGPGVTVEQRNAGVLVLMTGVARGVDDDASGPGSMLTVSMLLLPVLRCDCVKGAGGVGRVISTELCCEGGSSHGSGSKQALGVALVMSARATVSIPMVFCTSLMGGSFILTGEFLC